MTFWFWSYNGQSGEIQAYTRSEARSKLKKLLGIKTRLPKEVILEKAGG